MKYKLFPYFYIGLFLQLVVGTIAYFTYNNIDNIGIMILLVPIFVLAMLFPAGLLYKQAGFE